MCLNVSLAAHLHYRCEPGPSCAGGGPSPPFAVLWVFAHAPDAPDATRLGRGVLCSRLSQCGALVDYHLM